MRDLLPYLEHAATGDGMRPTAILFMRVNRRSVPGPPHAHVLSPSVGIFVAGHKRARVGDTWLEFSPGDVFTVLRPTHVISQVVRAPYLAVMLTIDTTLVADLLASPRAASSAFADPFARLVRLLEAPSEIPVLAPLLQREIFYRLLAGPAGDDLRALSRGHDAAVATATAWLEAHYTESFSADRLASHVHLSVSALYARFKTHTGLTPLQFQKRLRLDAARRLLLPGDVDLTAAARRVGYASVAQFCRDYRRTFATSPRRDIDALRRGSH